MSVIRNAWTSLYSFVVNDFLLFIGGTLFLEAVSLSRLDRLIEAGMYYIASAILLVGWKATSRKD
jgi:hypothetical protein